jgi:hypothetical protein
VGRKERTAFESKSSVNRDCQLEHNLSVFDSLHSIDLSNWQGQFQAFPTYLPTYRPTYLLYFMTYLRYFTTYPGNPRESTFLGQSLGIWQQKKSKSRLLCFGWESFQAFIFWRARVKKVTPEIYPIHTEKSEHQSFPNWRLLRIFFLSFMQIQSNMTLFGQLYYLVTI